MTKSYLTKSPSETKKLGEKLARKILEKNPDKKAFIVALNGELGGGKTTFLQGFARGLKIKEKILSPTFILMKSLNIPFPVKSRNILDLAKNKPARKKPLAASKGPVLTFKKFYHLDCYRIKEPKELFSLNFDKIISDPQNIIAIEWANKIKKILPKDIIVLKFDFLDKNKRRIHLSVKNKIKLKL